MAIALVIATVVFGGGRVAAKTTMVHDAAAQKQPHAPRRVRQPLPTLELFSAMGLASLRIRSSNLASLAPSAQYCTPSVEVAAGYREKRRSDLRKYSRDRRGNVRSVAELTSLPALPSSNSREEGGGGTLGVGAAESLQHGVQRTVQRGDV